MDDPVNLAVLGGVDQKARRVGPGGSLTGFTGGIGRLSDDGRPQD
jgi:hypothetical protein